VTGSSAVSPLLRMASDILFIRVITQMEEEEIPER
jgi:hypothetical protein